MARADPKSHKLALATGLSYHLLEWGAADPSLDHSVFLLHGFLLHGFLLHNFLVLLHNFLVLPHDARFLHGHRCLLLLTRVSTAVQLCGVHAAEPGTPTRSCGDPSAGGHTLTACTRWLHWCAGVGGA
jgi:hypothetical protein